VDKPNDKQQALLEQMAAAQEGTVDATGVHKAMVSALIQKGWMIVTPTTDGGDRLLITTAGRQAAGVETVEVEAPATASKTKLDLVADLLRQPTGATVEALMAATGWQAHSVRGAMSGALKKRGLKVSSEKADGQRIYRLEPVSA
jgi:hypothetical protein